MQSPSDTTVYQVMVTEMIGAEGLGTITMVGQLEELGGQTFVRFCDTLRSPDGWYVDRSEAERDAADVIEARAARLAAQVERLRAAAPEVA